jgi:hypothetical protein
MLARPTLSGARVLSLIPDSVDGGEPEKTAKQ